MSKPLLKDCERFCDLYPCYRIECDRRKGFRPVVVNKTIVQQTVMMPKKDADELDLRMRKRLYREDREVLVNGRVFLRKGYR